MAQTSSRLLLSPLLLLSACAGGTSGGGDGGGGPVEPPTGPSASTPLFALASGAGGPGSLRVDWTVPVPGFEVGIFSSTDRAQVFSTTPQVFTSETSAVFGGLTDGVPVYVGLGIRPTPRTPSGDPFTPSGPILTVVPGSPIYVDAGSTASNPDGLTPATAFPDLLSGLLTGLALGGGNVWVRAGSYPAANLPLFVGVHVSGGFGPAFDLSTRDPLDPAQRTLFEVPTGQKCLEIQGGDALGADIPAVIDGLEIHGDPTGQAGIGVDVISSSVELRRVTITGMPDRGIRVRNAIPDQSFDVLVASSRSGSNGGDGLSGSGAFDYFVSDSLFDANIQEGLDLDGLVPDTGGTATLDVAGSRFFGNGAEGIDATLKAALVPTSGTYSLRIRGCSFERNLLDGLLIDLDYELLPGHSADITVRECFARANGDSGVHLDLDAPATALLYRLQSSGNGEDGLSVTSESDPGLVVVSTSAFTGNLGAGLRALGPPSLPGNRTVSASHCLFAGNSAGGMVSRDVESAAVSSIAYLQPAPFSATELVGTISSDDPVAVGFTNAPEEYVRVVAWSGTSLTLSSAPDFGATATLELADDGIARAASNVAGSVVTLTETPEDFAAPGMLASFAPGVLEVLEDYTLLPGSIATAAGMTGSDAGIAGAPLAGRPGFADRVPVTLFSPLGTSPAPARGFVGALEQMDPLLVLFSADLAPGSVTGTDVRVRRGTSPLAVALSTAGPELSITPPPGGWGSGDIVLELDRGLLSSAGVPNAAPLAIPIRVE